MNSNILKETCTNVIQNSSLVPRLDYSLVLLRKGGLLVVDNLLWHGYAASNRVPANYKESTSHIREFNSLFMDQPNLKTTIIPIGDGIGLGVKI